MSEERRSQASVGARMRAPGNWGVWGGSQLPTATAAAAPEALPKVMLVGELAGVRPACREALEGLPIELAEVPTAAEALRLARASDFALAILETQLPDMGGFELAALLAQERHSDTAPIMFALPPDAGAEQLRTAHRMGAVDCLVPPLDGAILRQKVRVFCELQVRAAQLRGTLMQAQAEARALTDANRRFQDQQEVMRQQATHDLLTGLPARILLDDRFDGALKRAARNRQRVALAVIDLDGFKAVNERHGHATGDELIVATGRRLLQTVRASDTVARVGADEFAVVMEGLHSAAAAEHLGHKMAAAVSQPCTLLVDLEGRPVELAPAASVGIALYPDHGQDREALVAAAETAMYQAKQRGGGIQVHREGADAAPAAIRQKA